MAAIEDLVPWTHAAPVLTVDGMDAPRLLVPTDGSDLSLHALEVASDLARRADIPLTVFGLVFDDADRDEIAGFVEARVRACADDLDATVEISAVGAVVTADGAVARTIVTEADRDGALVCIASHGRSGVGVAILGSTTEEVLRASERPVLVVGPRVEPVDHPADEGRLVVCVDGSELAERAIEPAADVARQFRTTPWIVQAVSPPDLHAPAVGAWESNYVRSLANRIPGAQYEVFHTDNVADELAGLPERWPVDAFVMASHGRGGIARLILGSVAMRVVQRGSRPVLVVPAAVGSSD